MNLRERNLEALYRAHPELEVRRLEESPGCSELQILEAASGEPTARLAGTSVHSRYDPAREAERIVRGGATGGATGGAAGGAAGGITTAVFYGFGLGYHVEAFRRLCPGVPGVVIEPEAGVFVQALEARDLSALLGAPELFWHLGDPPEAAVMTLDALPLGRLRVFRLPALAPDSVEYFRRMDRAIRSLLDRREVNLNTLNRFGRLWIRNLAANIREFVLCPGVDQIRGSFEGIPALVLAAGPSLDELLPELPQLRERMLLVAVDTSFRLCREAGVEPDLLVTVDPQYWNTRHLDGVAVDRAVMVSESSAHPRLFRRLFRSSASAAPPLYFISSFFPLGRLLEEALGTKGRVGAGGSVATTAWDLARLLGCRPVYMAGLDLGYPGSRTHCRGAFFEERMHEQSARLRPAEGLGFQTLREAGPFPAENNSGGTTLTDRRLIIYKWWFENQMTQAVPSSPSPTFSLSREGVRIEGMPYAPPGSLRELATRRPHIDAALLDARRRARAHRRRVGERGLSAAAAVLESLEGDLERLQQLSARSVEVCRRLRSPEGGGAPAAQPLAGLLRELDHIDAEILGLSSRNVAGFLFQGLIHRVVDSPGGERSLPEVMEVSEQLYGELERSAAYHVGLLRAARRAARLPGRKSLKFPQDPPTIEAEG